MIDFLPKSALYRRRKAFRSFKRNVSRAYEMRHNPTLSEEKGFEILKELSNGERFYRQSCEGGFILDFFFPRLKLAIELDGCSHRGRERLDAARDHRLKRLGITVLHFPADIVFTEPNHFRAQISFMLEILSGCQPR